ncbi:hypothetical protein Scep_006388 [Stephania cephalantha]|uniref:O-fucosyltransferase family protein n=1 Tax=Stephania cephalantha TaxID=152367 RepID=A0AAP0K7Z7_9MAGN
MLEPKMIFRSRIKWAALGILVLSLFSMLAHLLLAKYSSAELVQYSALSSFSEDFTLKLEQKKGKYKKLWGNLRRLEPLQPYAKPRTEYRDITSSEVNQMFAAGNLCFVDFTGFHNIMLSAFVLLLCQLIWFPSLVASVPNDQNNGIIFAKIFGGFEKIRSSICDLVTISRLLNATLVLPEIQDSTRSKGISSRFKSFSYLYNEEQFIAALTNDVIIMKNLPKGLMEARKRNEFPTFKLKSSTSPSFYIKEVLPQLKKSRVIKLVLIDGGCLQSTLPPSMVEYQRLRCRVAFHALHFRPEIQALGRRMVERLRAWGQPYLVFHSGLMRDTLAYHGCAELFQDVHTELIQYRRAQLIKKGIINEELSVDSRLRKLNGSCPLMPEEFVLRVSQSSKPESSELFGGQRVLIPLRAMFANLVDRTSLCSKQELSNLIDVETPLPSDSFQPPPAKSKEELREEWKKAGPRPRPLPPPPDRPIYRHEKEGWYGWIAEKDTEPDPSPSDLRMQAHRLLWDALDYIVSLEADAFFPGFHNDGSGLPDFSSLVMGHRLYEMASARTYRPDRKYIAELFKSSQDNIYHPPRNWTLIMREHLNKSLSEEGLVKESRFSKPFSFLAHPLPECSCRISESSETHNGKKVVDNDGLIYEQVDECPTWMQHGIKMVSFGATGAKEEMDEDDTPEDETDLDMEFESDDKGGGIYSTPSSEQDEEMDPDD